MDKHSILYVYLKDQKHKKKLLWFESIFSSKDDLGFMVYSHYSMSYEQLKKAA